RITSESGVAAGIRRIEAVTNQGAFALAEQERELLRQVSEQLRVPTAQVPDRIARLQESRKELEQSLQDLRNKQAQFTADELAANAETIGDVKVVAIQIEAASRDDLLTLGD